MTQLPNIPQILRDLAEQRPIFHSEADFQHELAWHLREADPSLRPRLEYPFGRLNRRACDIVLIRNGIEMALELKYLCQKLECEIGGETFRLEKQGAQNIRRLQTLEDIERMEGFLGDHPSAQAHVVLLTNHDTYWKGSAADTADAEFDIREGRIVTGDLNWAQWADKWKPTPAVNLRGSYIMQWQDYSRINGKHGLFRFLHIPVQMSG